MLFSRRLFAGLTALATTASAQTYSSCNPLQQTTCPADTALGMAIHVDFTQGAVNSFAASGNPTYGSDGVTFSVAASGQAPQLMSLFYIMFGRVEITLKAATGAGIVSSLVLQSDTLDEIDMEWLGADPTEVQSNYFGKGDVTTYNRGQFHQTSKNNQENFMKYTIDWTSERIVFSVDGTVVRTLKESEADTNQYPQSPMQVKFGSWSGGDPANAAGTIDWARGPTDFSKGPFHMVVKDVSITDYSTGKEYKYTDTTGNWGSIQAVDGQVNGNLGKASQVTYTASAAAETGSPAPTVPRGGIGADESASATQTGWPWVASARPTGGSVPDGWRMTSEGKIIPDGAGSSVRPSCLVLVVSFAVGIFALTGR
ncbi:glycosyl hydrolase family 16 [Colletotrichum abscissum]|uniref:chitinase n=3 Tax=Colletotrichum acutatum species complex TaxID=2707335 RepID=A0A9P9XBL0_9PEZI|nr:glycosyl hydrolase family 16 [Colletotrichum lupini]XP_060394301.1 glycosyl hydrolase family 16 [Colletotrichum abscissum]KAK1467850.1 glycosyl hydrolase family 16 [Colletotrichum cuscutae]KAI3544753.1 glycosyl hydrolase family 16 [Colletotrichum abscissum]KAK1483276.1 glycosyl hydrolase family 16 [Colletotrichum abscissum]UQC79853.1 glycosyl hydrolase family 16 [Colletotrichum lupini]